MKRGFFKIMRCDFDRESYGNLELIGLHTYLKFRVNLKAKKWQGVMLYPGQFATSMGKLSDDVGKSIKTVKIMLAKLKKDGLIKTKNRANRFTIISICNPHLYGLQPCMTGLTNALTKYPTKGRTGEPQLKEYKELNKYIFNTRERAFIERYFSTEVIEALQTFANSFFETHHKKLIPDRFLIISKNLKELPKDDHLKSVERSTGKWDDFYTVPLDNETKKRKIEIEKLRPTIEELQQ